MNIQIVRQMRCLEICRSFRIIKAINSRQSCCVVVIVDEYEKEKKIKIKKNVKSKVGIPPTMVLHFFCKVLKEKMWR